MIFRLWARHREKCTGALGLKASRRLQAHQAFLSPFICASPGRHLDRLSLVILLRFPVVKTGNGCYLQLLERKNINSISFSVVRLLGKASGSPGWGPCSTYGPAKSVREQDSLMRPGSRAGEARSRKGQTGGGDDVGCELGRQNYNCLLPRTGKRGEKIYNHAVSLWDI